MPNSPHVYLTFLFVCLFASLNMAFFSVHTSAQNNSHGKDFVSLTHGGSKVKFGSNQHSVEIADGRVCLSHSGL